MLALFDDSGNIHQAGQVILGGHDENMVLGQDNLTAMGDDSINSPGDGDNSEGKFLVYPSYFLQGFIGQRG